MIVAVTGGSGAVGRRLVQRHLDLGDVVRVLSRRPATEMPETVRAYQGGLLSEVKVLAGFADGADVLYHCAAEIHDPIKMITVNVEGTRRLIRAARNKIGHWVQLGSIAVYGAPQCGVITEESPLCPIDVYGRSKAEADRLVIEAPEREGISYSVLRPAKIFGAGMNSQTNQILYRMISIIDQGLFFFIGKPGALTHYVHIDNVVEALIRCGRAHTAKNRVYNLSDDRLIEEFVAVIAGALGKPLPRLRLPEFPVRLLARVVGELPGFPLTERRVAALVNRAVFPCDRIQHELDYVHPVPVEQGLCELVRSWKQAA